MKRKASIGIKDAVFKLPNHYITIDDLFRQYTPYIQRIRQNELCLPKFNTVDFKEVDRICVFQNEPRGELVIEAINDILHKNKINGKDISFLIDFSTTSHDENGISLCYKVQSEINADNALTLAIGNGSCSQLHLALKAAVSMINEDNSARYALLFSEDRVVGRRINIPSNVLGDGTSVLLLEKNCRTSQIKDIQFISLGKYHDVLGINHCEESNFKVNKFEQYIVPRHYRIIKELTDTVLKRNNLQLKDIELVLYQNMSNNDYKGLIWTLGISPEKVFTSGLKGRGHIFGADLVINYCLAKERELINRRQNILLISSGAGFSWGVTLITS